MREVNKPGRRRYWSYWRKYPVGVIFLGALLVFTLIAGGLGAQSLEGLWKATGLLIGETSYQPVDEFAQLDEPAGHSPGPEDGTTPEASAAGEEVSLWRGVCLWIARLCGMAFILSALFVLMFEQLRGPIRRLRVMRWGLMSAAWRVAEEEYLGREARENDWDYVLICGLGWKGREIARNLRQQGSKASIIEKNPENPSIETVKLLGAKVFIGDAADAEVLRKAGARHARKIYVVSANDEVDCRIVQQIAGLLPEGDALPCENNDTFSMTACDACEAPRAVHVYAGVEGYRSQIFLENKRWAASMHVHCFNMEELIAREVFRRNVWPRLAGVGQRNMAFCIFGWTPMAREVLLHVLRSAHLHKDQQRDVVVFCQDPEERSREFLEDFPCLKPRADLSPAMKKATEDIFPALRFEKLPRSNAGLLSPEFLLYKHIQPGWQTHVFYGIDDGVKSEALANLVQPRLEWLAGRVNAADGEGAEVHSHVYYNYPEDEGIGEPSGTGRGEPVTGPERFGAYNHFCRPEVIARSTSEEHARAIAAFFHAQYADEAEQRKLKSMLSQDVARPKQPSRVQCYMQHLWERSADWERESNRQAAAHIPAKLALLGLLMTDQGAIEWADGRSGDAKAHLLSVTAFRKGKTKLLTKSRELPALAEMEHRRWCAERLLGGWIPLATPEEKDVWKDKSSQKVMKKQLRMHGDLIPFRNLPAKEKGKDYGIIAAMWFLGARIDKVITEALPEEKGE